MKKHLKWILPTVIALVAVLAVGAALLLTSGGEGETRQTAPTTEPVAEREMKVYWNVERATYEHDWNDVSHRQRSDGYYRIRFAVDGEQVDLNTDSMDVAAVIDNKYFMGLVFDDQGLIIDVVDVEEFTGGTAYIDYYVESFTDTSLTVNCTANLRGPRVTYPIDKNTEIYNATGTGIMVGQPGKLQVGAKISAILGKNQVLSHVYVEDPFEKSPVYWNMTRMFDSTTKLSTRPSDDIGYYTFQFAVEGEQVELKTKDYEVATYIDSVASQCLHLEFDEQGYIIRAAGSRSATGGGSIASWYHIIELTDQTFLAKRFTGTDAGKTASGYFAADLQVFDMSGMGAYIGEPTTLRLYDRIHCLRNAGGDVCTVFVVSRFMEGDMYWNLEQKYDKTAQKTTRIPDAQGWYYLKMAVNGGNTVLKTKDVQVVNSIDARAARCCVLQVDGDVIKAFGQPSSHFCGVSFCSWADVTSLENGEVTAKKAETGVISTGVMAADCKVYNVSESAIVPGEVTQLQVGDRIHALKNLNGEVGLIYIVSRPVDSDIYYNVARKWDSNNKVSTREPAADGWYYIDLAVNGKVITVKTNDRSVVDSMDSGLTMGLALGSNNTVLKHYKITSVKGYTGGAFLSGGKITGLSGSYLTATKDDKTESISLAWNCKVYNLSNKAMLGKPTTLRVGDTIHSIKNADGQLAAVYVLSRPVISEIYWNVQRQYDSANKVTKRTPAADGWYYITLAVKGEQKTFKTKNKDIATAVDSYATRVMGLELNGNEIIGVYANKSIKGYEGGSTASWYTVNSINGNRLEVEKKIESDRDYGTKMTITIPKGCPVYNCTNSFTSHMGEPGQVKVGDKVHCLTNKAGTIVHVAIVDRMLTHELYWNVTRMYDKDAKVTLRTPNAEGWYHIEMVGPNGLQTLKTQDQKIATAVDSRAAFVMALKVEDDVITNVYSTGQVYRGASGSLCDWGYRVTQITGDGTVTFVKDGDARVAQLDADTKVYDVSDSGYFGDTVQLKEGDEVRGVFLDAAGKLGAVFVYTHSRTAYCQICGEDVTFMAWGGKSALSDGHYYLEKDVTVSAQKDIAAGREVTLDLCGHTVTGTDSINRIFNIYGTLNLTDTKEDGVFKGNVIATAEGRLASVFYVREGGLFNLYGGNLTCTKPSSEAGIGTVYKSTMNFYDGRIYGGEATEKGGGNLGIFTDATVNMYGGSIEGGKSSTTGGNVLIQANATLRMLGGLITGGEAAAGGSGVYTNGNVILGGSARITGNTGSNLWLNKNQPVTLESNLTENAVGVSMASGVGVIAQAVPEQAQTWFVSDDGLFIRHNAEGNLVLADDSPTHCHVCNQDVTFMVWDGVTKLTDGHWYLKSDVTAKAQQDIAKDSEVTLFLNGHTVTGDASINRIFNIYGTLNLTDTKEDGVFKGNVIATAEGRLASVFYVREGGMFNLYGGNLTCTKPSSEAGIGTVYKSTMNFYDGRIYGGSVTEKGGGNLGIFSGATVNMYGGSIEGGKSSTTGGNVLIQANATLRMLGGLITGGEAATGGSGVYANGTVILGGSARITGNTGSNLWLNKNQPITLESDLTKNAVGVSLASGLGVFTGSVSQGAEAWFVSDGGYQIKCNADGKLELVAAVPTHCHVCDRDVTFTAWDGTTKLTDGHWYLASDVSVTAQMDIAKDDEVTLFLNGHTATGTASINRIFNIFGTLNLTDTKTDGTFKGNVIATAEGRLAPVFYVREGGLFNLYGGNLTCTKTATEAGVGTVYKSTMNFYDGRIYGGSVTEKGGGNLGIFDAAIFNMYGGSIEGGKSTTMGGNVYSNSTKSTFRMLGGSITGGEAATGGSGVLANGTVILGGSAAITGNAGDNLLLNKNQTITLESDLTENAVGISMAAGTGVFTGAVAEGAQKWFVPCTGYLVQRNADGKLELKAAE